MRNEQDYSHFNQTRLLKRSCESLIGICTGLIADGELNDKEVVFLSTWLRENVAIATCWPGEAVYARVREVLADGHVSTEERAYLMDTLQQLAGGSFAETGAIPFAPNTLPVNDNADVQIRNHSFCFTGQFIFGTRQSCETAVTVRGGTPTASLNRKTNYLVIGQMASRAWKNTSHGIKIERAVEFQDEGHPIEIVSEARWIGSLS